MLSCLNNSLSERLKRFHLCFVPPKLNFFQSGNETENWEFLRWVVRDISKEKEVFKKCQCFLLYKNKSFVLILNSSWSFDRECTLEISIEWKFNQFKRNSRWTKEFFSELLLLEGNGADQGWNGTIREVMEARDLNAGDVLNREMWRRLTGRWQ